MSSKKKSARPTAAAKKVAATGASSAAKKAAKKTAAKKVVKKTAAKKVVKKTAAKKVVAKKVVAAKPRASVPPPDLFRRGASFDPSPVASLDAWRALSDDARSTFTEDLVGALGSDYSRGDLAGSERLASVLHIPTGARLIAVPGGTFEMGMRDNEVEEIMGLYAKLGRADEARGYVIWASRPVCRVAIQPFLCAADLLSDAARAKLIGGEEGDEEEVAEVGAIRVAEILVRAGLRLISEAEWEYVAREGGPRGWLCPRPSRVGMHLDLAGGALDQMENAFGVKLLRGFVEMVADAYHKTHEGRPSDGRAWDAVAVPAMWRGAHSCWQDDMEAIRLHAGVREGRMSRGESAAVRFARNLP